MNAYKTVFSPEHFNKLFNEEYGVSIVRNEMPITFNHNINNFIHRWSPYIQGFSSSFVDNVIENHLGINQTTLTNFNKSREDLNILDPFSGSGTVLVSSKLHNINSIGVELNPLLHFTSKVKNEWNVNVQELERQLNNLKWDFDPSIVPPRFLQTEKQFRDDILLDLRRLKENIISIQDDKTRDLFMLAFSSILITVSNLTRAPCLGYKKNKNIPENAVRTHFKSKISHIISDLKQVQRLKTTAYSDSVLANSKDYVYEDESIDLAITSPPYASGMDYVINYKIEMAWLDFITNHKEAKELKDDMVVCDNVSRDVPRKFKSLKSKYCDPWLDEIIENLEQKMIERPKYRRLDMPIIVHKYFDDLYQVLARVYDGLKENGTFSLVIGDSLMADVYVPTDLIIAKAGESIGFNIESVTIARDRRSGQRRDFKLRESITVLKK